jgi:asparagine synthase (glutamine-hydrolysing)
VRGDELLTFHGHIDNGAALAHELRLTPRSAAHIYAHALEKWGDDADRHVIGEYAAVLVTPGKRQVRLSRSPLRAPPLHYYQSTDLLAAASVPRALFAAGAPRQLNAQRVADSLWLNFSDETANWYEDLARVPLGTVVTLSPAQKQSRRYYDLAAVAAVRPRSDKECLEQVAASKRPAVALSGGLDSPQVAARALAQLPAHQTLPSFTFVPEPGWDGICTTGMNGDERAAVEAFAAMHPRLRPQFVANEGIAHDHRWSELFHLMGVAPSGLCNMYAFHGLAEAAARNGCDRLLVAEWGNSAFSARGEWAFPELLLSGRWRELWRALARNPHDPRSMPRRLATLAILPVLPASLRRGLQRLAHRGETPARELISPLTQAYAESSGARARADAAGIQQGNEPARNRREAVRRLLINADAESAETYQAFEQLYGVELRDPLAYRPLVEYCIGLPTRMFMREGEPRWLAKQLGAGLMPESQRANRSNGRWDADWHLRIGRRRDDWLAELDRISADPALAEMFDVPRLRQALEEFPDRTSTDPNVWIPLEMGVPRLLLTARFIDFVEGRNR